MKRRIKVYNKIKLYETSAVGIPAYPDAHASTSFSLTKAVSSATLKGFVDETEEIGDKLNLMEEKETMENKPKVVKQEEVEVEATEEPAAETEAEPEDTEKKSDISEIIAKAIKEGIKDGLKELETERGLVEKQTETVKSLGELAIRQGLFVEK